MSTDYSVSVYVGYSVTREELIEVFGKKIITPEKRIPQFSPDTGDPVADKVIPESTDIQFSVDGENYYDEIELIMEELVDDLLDCWFIKSDNAHDYIPDLPFIFAIKTGVFQALTRLNDELEWGALNTGSGYQIQSIKGLDRALKGLKARLEKVGFKRLGFPKIMMTSHKG